MLAEIAVAMVVFTIATGMLLQLIASGQGLRRTAREEWAATAAGQNVLEVMRSVTFEELVRRYDADPFNDPAGPGTAFGSTFPVDGLDAAEDDPDGIVGEIILPSVNTGTTVAPIWQVREDLGDPLLGMPRDLNGDAIINDADHSSDYAIVPILVRIRWQGAYGPRELRLFSSITKTDR